MSDFKRDVSVQGTHCGKVRMTICPAEGAQVAFHHYLTGFYGDKFIRCLDDAHGEHFPPTLWWPDGAGWSRALS